MSRRSSSSDGGTDWFTIVAKYVVPGMLVLAVLGVLLYNTGGDVGGGSVFKDIGGAMFNFGGV